MVVLGRCAGVDRGGRMGGLFKTAADAKETGPWFVIGRVRARVTHTGKRRNRPLDRPLHPSDDRAKLRPTAPGDDSNFHDAEKVMKQYRHFGVERRFTLGERAIQIKHNKLFQFDSMQ